MTETLNTLLKISLVIFMAGNLLGMGLQLRVGTALAQVIFYAVVTAGAYAFAVGLPPSQKSVLALGVCTRNLGAALAPLFAMAGIDERVIVMVALGVPLQTIAAVVAARVFGARAGGCAASAKFGA